ncbi:helix-turn-helix domain-containing protein [Verrucomicrobiota bacterium]
MKTHLRDARRAARLTALQLADAASTLESRVYQIERGRYRARPEEAAALAAVLMRPVDELFPAGVQKGRP